MVVVKHAWESVTLEGQRSFLRWNSTLSWEEKLRATTWFIEDRYHRWITFFESPFIQNNSANSIYLVLKENRTEALSAVDGYHSPTMQCTKKTKELLTAGHFFNELWMVMKQLQKDLGKPTFCSLWSLTGSEVVRVSLPVGIKRWRFFCILTSKTVYYENWYIVSTLYN